MPQSLAFKCTYNDGDSEEFVGLRGTCSLDLIAFNVENHVWCMQKVPRSWNAREQTGIPMHGEQAF